MYRPNIWRILYPILFSAYLEKSGPKHSTNVPSSSRFTVALRVDENKGPLVPNPVSVVTVKGLPSPQGAGSLAVLCSRVHSLVPLLPPFTLQRVTPSLSPVTVHVKVKVSPGQVGGAPPSCSATTPAGTCMLYR